MLHTTCFKAMLKRPAIEGRRRSKEEKSESVSHFPNQQAKRKLYNLYNPIHPQVFQNARIYPRKLGHFFSLMHTRRGRVQIDIQDVVPLVIALADEGGKVLGGALALALDLDGLVALVAEVLDALVEADAEVVGGEAEDLADRRGDAAGVGVDVVELGELSGDFGGETGREGVGDLLEDVGGGSDC